MLTVAIPKRNKLQNIIVLTPKDGFPSVQSMPNGEKAWISESAACSCLVSSIAIYQLYDAGSGGSVETVDLWLTKKQTVI